MLACTDSSATTLIQLREPLASHAHDDADEVLYVVAGEGTVSMAERGAIGITPGALVVIPRDVQHSVERKGRNPLILMSILTGSAPCPADARATTSQDRSNDRQTK
jgi:mannose-6-phosphate isomerase-like protein (cupin superfamily)